GERLVHAFEIAVGKNESCACFCERMRGMTANPFGAARDDYYFSLHELPSVQISIDSFLFLMPIAPVLQVSVCPRGAMVLGCWDIGWKDSLPRCLFGLEADLLVAIVAKRFCF